MITAWRVRTSRPDRRTTTGCRRRIAHRDPATPAGSGAPAPCPQLRASRLSVNRLPEALLVQHVLCHSLLGVLRTRSPIMRRSARALVTSCGGGSDRRPSVHGHGVAFDSISERPTPRRFFSSPASCRETWWGGGARRDRFPGRGPSRVPGTCEVTRCSDA